MDRTKPPVLTSPWKIGFFVALMLITVSVGVAYFVAKSFGVVWPQLAEWGWEGVLHGNGFAFGLTPIMAMVVMASLASYFMITAAVRKYRRYLDSGKDYRHLMQTLREIDDLDDPAQLALLDNYRELREFLAGVRNETLRRREDLDQREQALGSAATDAARGREEEVGQRVSEQAQFLVTAINRHPDGAFDNMQEVTLPAMKKVEESIRAALRGPRNSAQSLGGADPDLESKIAEVMREIELNSRAARDIEREIQHLADSGMPGTPDSGEVRRGLDSVITVFEAMDKLTQNLGVLGEEATGVAINTALKAGSGSSSQADVVQLAEDVKDVAAKFKGTATGYNDMTRELRAALTNIEVSLGDMMAGANSYEGSVIGTVADRIGRWVERSMLLSEKARELSGVSAPNGADVNGFEKSDNPFETSPLNGLEDNGSAATEEPAAAEAPATAADDSDAFETFDQGAESVFHDAPDAAAIETAAGEEGSAFEPLDSGEAVLGDNGSEEAPIDGLQNQERGIFDEMSTQDEMFAELGSDGPSTPVDKTAEPETVGSAHGHPVADADADSDQGEFVGQGFSDWDGDASTAPGFDNGGGQEEAAAAQEAPAIEAVPEPEVAPEAEAAPMDEAFESNVFDITPKTVDEDAIDLYALGAEDFNPAVHQ